MSFHGADSLREGAHHYVARVYYEDTDAGGVVYHAKYLGFAERARTEALRDLGVPHAELVAQHGVMFMVRSAKLEYLSSARPDDALEIVTRPVDIRGASVELNQRISRITDARLLVVADIRLACVRLEDQRAARIPQRWREALQRLGG